MESFANSSEMRVALCAAPSNDPQATFRFLYSLTSSNTPDIYVSPANSINNLCGSNITGVMAPQGNNMLRLLGAGSPFWKHEGIAFPLCAPIDDGQCVIVRFWASKPPECSGSFHAQIEFMPNPPESDEVVYTTPGSVSSPTYVQITDYLPDFGFYEVVIAHPNSGPDWNYMLFSLSRSGSLASALFDDIQVIRPTAEFTYTDDCQEVAFTSASYCSEAVEHLWEFGDGTTSTLANPTHYFLQAGTYTVTHTVSITCNETEQSVADQQTLIVEDCSELFDCACEHGININAEHGLPVSALGISQLDLSQHEGCLAIRGTLIIDQPFEVLNGDIRMQPCAEIVVNPYQHLSMEYNNIYGCETMWKSIRVEPVGRLTFRYNTIADAQHALWVNPTLPFSGFFSTQVDIQHNRFERDHIGLYIPGQGGGIFGGGVWQTPFFGNVMECQSKNNSLGELLPPCDAGLPNYDEKYGYAGAAILGANFNIGASSGVRNQFINLRNGVIAENVFVDVQRSDFENMIGFMDTDPPAFSFSAGVGVAANGGRVNVSECTFDGAGQAVHSYNGMILLRNSETDHVRVGLELRRPLSVVMTENDQIGFLRYGVRGWDLRNTPWLEKYIFDDNVFQTQDNQTQAGAEKGNAMLLWNNNTNVLLTSDFEPKITRNIITLDDYVRGIKVDGIGGWHRIADNEVTINLPSSPPTADFKSYGLSLNRSDINYVYGNTVTSSAGLGAQSDGSKGFEIAMSAYNIYCCNATDGTNTGIEFLGTCSESELRQTDFDNHNFSLLLQDNTIIGHQPYQGTGTNTTNSNRFHTGSGTAQHYGPDPIVDQSWFFVTDGNTPHYPEAIAPPYDMPGLWFKTNDATTYTCSTDAFCPSVVYPAGKRSALSLTDISLASGVFDTLPDAAMLRWELARDLYARLKTYPEMLGDTAVVDSFYSVTDSGGPIKAFYMAERMVAEVDATPAAFLTALQYLQDSIEAIETESMQVLNGLDSVGTRADSLEIYWQAQAVLDRLTAPAAALAEAQIALDSLRQARAVAAMTAVDTLPENDVLQTNLKTVWRTYLDWCASDAAQLTETQFDSISDIAHQCPLVGGRAVFIARGLYRTKVAAYFDDDSLCASTGARYFVRQQTPPLEQVLIRPNPASDQVRLSFQSGADERAQVQLFDLAGRLVLEETGIPGDGILDLNLSAVKTGLYICRVSTAGRRFAPLKLSIIH